MALIYEFFGYRADDKSDVARRAVASAICPFLSDKCEKRFNDEVVSGVCSVKPVTSPAVICCPIRLYAEDYKILRKVSDRAFSPGLEIINGRNAVMHAQNNKTACVAVFGKKWGGELYVPKKNGSGKYFVDWILALLDDSGELMEFVAVEVQTIDTTGTYRNGYEELKRSGEIINTSAGLNWENVNKRILPQLVYKGQLLQREELCKKGLFFVCPRPVYNRIMARVDGANKLVKYSLQPAALTFLVYDYDVNDIEADGYPVSLDVDTEHTTTVYKLQEAFNNVTLPEENVYKKAILRALSPIC